MLSRAASLIPTGPADGGPRMGEAAADVVIGGPRIDADAVGAVYREIDPSFIEPNPRQPRQVFDEEALAELVHSIREFGLMQPIVVREVGDTDFLIGEQVAEAPQCVFHGLDIDPSAVEFEADDPVEPMGGGCRQRMNVHDRARPDTLMVP